MEAFQETHVTHMPDLEFNCRTATRKVEGETL